MIRRLLYCFSSGRVRFPKSETTPQWFQSWYPFKYGITYLILSDCYSILWCRCTLNEKNSPSTHAIFYAEAQPLITVVRALITWLISRTVLMTCAGKTDMLSVLKCGAINYFSHTAPKGTQCACSKNDARLCQWPWEMVGIPKLTWIHSALKLAQKPLQFFYNSIH